VTDFLSFCPFGISIFPFLTIGISMYQKSILPYIIIPYFLTPSFFPFGAFQTDGQTTFFTPLYLSSFFFPLSARGPTRRRNSTGLAELWGGWPIELETPGYGDENGKTSVIFNVRQTDQSRMSSIGSLTPFKNSTNAKGYFHSYVHIYVVSSSPVNFC
jgi:hypothetical protein